MGRSLPSLKIRDLIRVTIALFFVSPILVWLMIIDRWGAPDWSWVHPLLVAVSQAGLSAFGSVAIGVLMAAGALSVRSDRFERWLEYWLLIPNLIPPIFLILAVLNLSDWLPFLRGGLPAVILTHVLVNSGLVALSLVRLIGSRTGGYVDAAVIAGAGRRTIWTEIVLPALRSEILFLGLFVFSVCLTSFSIPMVLGGVRAANLEILIYESLRTSGDWYRVIYYALVQMMTLFIFGLLVPKPDWQLMPTSARMTSIGIPALLPLTVFSSAVLLGGWMMGLLMAALHFVPEALPRDLWVSALNTVAISLAVGGAILLLLLLIGYVTPHRRFFQFMKGYLAPSSAITAYAFLLIPGQGESWALVKISIALTLVLFPLLFRWIGQPALEALEEQIYVARTLGASWGLILFEVILPQGASAFFRMAGLGALWASGDFAISSIIAEGDRTWALSISSAMGAYRLDLASIMTVPLFILGLLCYGFFRGAGRYVAR